KVTVTVDYDHQNVAVIIEDDGPGYAHDVLARIGEPYVTERHNDTRAGGLGLGLFIAKTLLERSGATVAFENRGTTGTGARVTIVWPRALMEDKRSR
ncbi:ATP-binding protein, partial [Agrobacterium sp. S2]|nr:ATP-binding protein [Agrobacterium sp. S2]